MICLLFLGAASGAAFTLKTITLYSGVCDALPGFPGMLQSAGFVPKGDCRLETRGRERECSDEPCKVNGKTGHCVKQVVLKKATCVCVPNKISR